MKLYLVNVDHWVLPERAWRLLVERGHQVGGNWSPPGFPQDLGEFAPDVIVYAPHRQRDPLPWREAALELPPDLVSETPTVLWALYPDYLTGWDQARNEHADSFLEPLKKLLPSFRAILAGSQFTKRLLEARAPRTVFDVCYLGIDITTMDQHVGKRPRGQRPRSVLWHHRWATDKNFQDAVDILLEMAPRFPEVTFYLGRRENWDEPFWSPQWLKDLYASRMPALERQHNIRFAQHFSMQEEYWHFLASIDIAFSCSHHETFGIAMLEQAYAGAACVVPHRAVYPEVHAGALVVHPAQVREGIEALLTDPVRWARVTASSRANAARYDVQQTVGMLLGFAERAMRGRGTQTTPKEHAADLTGQKRR